MKRILTSKFIENLQAAEKPYEIYDTVASGLSLIVHPTGRMVWVWRGRIRGTLKKLTLGQFPPHSLKAARSWAGETTEARDLDLERWSELRSAELALRRAELDRAGRTCDWLFALYFDVDGSKNKTVGQQKRLYAGIIRPAIGSKSIHDVTYSDLDTLIEVVNHRAPSQARLARALLMRVFLLACSKYRRKTLLDFNPSSDLSTIPSQSRERILDAAETRRLLVEVNRDRCTFNRAVQLMLYTGVRKSEALGAQWAEIDLEKAVWTIPAIRSKNRLPHVVPLSSSVIHSLLLRQPDGRLSGPVFLSPAGTGNPLSSIYRALERLRSRVAHSADGGSASERWTIHDIRRTVASGIYGLHDVGGSPLVSGDIVERILNHKIAGVRGVYNRYGYLREKRRALQLWSDHLDRLSAADA